MNNLILAGANVIALAAAYMLWDLGAWLREQRNQRRFKTIVGAISAHVALVTIYCFITYQVLLTASYFRAPG